jgi:hypothetical protein
MLRAVMSVFTPDVALHKVRARLNASPNPRLACPCAVTACNWAARIS